MSREEKTAVKKAVQEWNSPTASAPPTKKTVGVMAQSEQVRILSQYVQLSLFDERSGNDERSGVTRLQS